VNVGLHVKVNTASEVVADVVRWTCLSVVVLLVSRLSIVEIRRSAIVLLKRSFRDWREVRSKYRRCINLVLVLR